MVSGELGFLEKKKSVKMGLVVFAVVGTFALSPTKSGGLGGLFSGAGSRRKRGLLARDFLSSAQRFVLHFFIGDSSELSPEFIVIRQLSKSPALRPVDERRAKVRQSRRR